MDKFKVNCKIVTRKTFPFRNLCHFYYTHVKQTLGHVDLCMLFFTGSTMDICPRFLRVTLKNRKLI